MKGSNYTIKEQTEDAIILEDLGPWDQYATVTNDAEAVVTTMLPFLLGRRLAYYDSDNELTELIIKDGAFAGFGINPEGI